MRPSGPLAQLLVTELEVPLAEFPQYELLVWVSGDKGEAVLCAQEGLSFGQETNDNGFIANGLYNLELVIVDPGFGIGYGRHIYL
jgi:hypothetical protein